MRPSLSRNPAGANHSAAAIRCFCLCFSRNAKSGTRPRVCAFVRWCGKRGEAMWLALAAIRLLRRKDLAASHYSFRSSVSPSSACLAGGPAFKGRRPMSTIAAAAQTADRIDYWIRRHVIQYCYGTHPSQSQTKFNSARDRRVGLLAIGQCLKDQYDALATRMPRHLAALVHQLETQR
jgi:hypothetical protein